MYINKPSVTKTEAADRLKPIWTGGGGGAKWLPRVFAKYLKNGFPDLHETL